MKILVLISLLFTTFFVSAGAVTAAGTVTLSGNGGHGVIIVKLEGSGNTTCGDGLRYWFKPDSDYNKAILSMLLSAQMSGKRVYATGSGDCLSEYPYNKALLLTNLLLMND